MCSREVAKLISDVLELPSLVVPDLNVTCEIPLAVYFAELIERFICNVGNIELMVAYSISLLVICKGIDVADRLSEDHNRDSQRLGCLLRHLVW